MSQPEDPIRDELSLLRAKRFQRAVEYSLLAALHLFFVVSFHAFLRWWMAGTLAATTFGMNFRLTLLRERRRTASPRNRARIVGDTFESILFLLFVVILTIGGVLKGWLEMSDQEFLGYVAAMLAALFLAGLSGEVVWQIRNLRFLSIEQLSNYVTNLRRTIIFPFFR